MTHSPLTTTKIQLYFAANHLFSLGKSHPQIVEALSEFEPDQDLLKSVVDAAMTDRWRTILNEAQRLTAEGKNFQEIVEAVQPIESDPEIVDFVCNAWYRVQAVYAEHSIESGTNIMEGSKWTIISALGLAFVFGVNASIFSKVIWSVSFLGALVTWIYGLRQKRVSAELKQVLEGDYMRYKNLI
ncbi:MAG: hypothetical protein EOO09_13260 [Chitinophagaceae bacterium]|nr:MAG: hypothetical protein EOO09_13260 [Chitinophagaceae bacterium]